MIRRVGLFKKALLRRGEGGFANSIKKAKTIIVALSILLISTLLISPSPILLRYPEENEYSPRDIKSPFDFEYVNEKATRRKVEEAVSRVLPVYDLDLVPLRKALKDIDTLFEEVRRLRERRGITLEEKIGRLREKIDLSRDTLRVLLVYPKIEELETGTKAILHKILSSGISDVPESLLRREGVFGIKIVKIAPDPDEEKIVIRDVDDIYLLKDLRNKVPHLEGWPPLSFEAKRAGIDLVVHFATPNLRFNPEATSMAKEEAAANVKPVKERVRKGEMIVREGEIVDREAAIKISVLKDMFGGVGWQPILGFFILLLCLMVLIGIYLYKYRKGLGDHPRSLILLGIISIITIVLARLITITPYPKYLVPVASASMFIAILLDEEISLFITLFLSLLVGLVVGGELEFLLFFLAGGLAAVYGVSFVRTRGDLIKVGLLTSVANMTVVAAYGFATQEPFTVIGTNVMWAFANGLISAFLTIGGLPFLEGVFGFTTNFRLLELADLNNPLLRDLLVRAPGTHHHSLLVGNLSEQAANATGANPLLARVASYYHDIGKMDKPQYFVENREDKNRHESLKSSLSVSILRSHVKEGIELAKKKRLPRSIIDIIQQHHGTTLMTYFYHQALEEGRRDKVDEKDFRYLGPRPQTKEAAIVLLADAVEAAARTLAKPTAVRIEELIKRIVNEKFIDTQLDECELTLKDLTMIGQSFTRTLMSAYHPRIEYPETNDAKDISGKPPLEKITD
jgi:hypothetical protein